MPNSKVVQPAVLFTRPDAPVRVALWFKKTDKPYAPLFGGMFDKEQVSVFERRARKGNKPPFLSFVNNDNRQLATGNVRIRESDGVPFIALRVGPEDGRKIDAYLRISKAVSDDMLVRLGADPAKLHVKAGQPAKKEKDTVVA